MLQQKNWKKTSTCACFLPKYNEIIDKNLTCNKTWNITSNKKKWFNLECIYFASGAQGGTH